jgi:lactam utilization protein B
MIFDQKVDTAHGSPIAIEANTVCVHGDGPYAFEIATALHHSLKNNSIEIKHV